MSKYSSLVSPNRHHDTLNPARCPSLLPPLRVSWSVSELGSLTELNSIVRSEGNIFTRRYKMPKEPNYRQIEKTILDDVLKPELYDPRIRPAGLNSTGERRPGLGWRNKKLIISFQMVLLMSLLMCLSGVSPVLTMSKWWENLYFFFQYIYYSKGGFFNVFLLRKKLNKWKSEKFKSIFWHPPV